MKTPDPLPRKDEDFASWFKRQKFRNFTAREVMTYFDEVRRGVKNSTPPRNLWQHIVPTLRVVDDLRDWFGRPVVLTSTYRSPEYNRAVGGAKFSQHVDFRAIDFVVSGVKPSESYQLLLDWRRDGKFKGGLGKYPTFVHVDTRGYNANW